MAGSSTSARYNEDAEFDSTELNATGHGWRVHRDYLAHTIRWGFAGRWIGKRTSGKRAERVLEAGCGSTSPMWDVMRAYGSYVPKLYVGIDLGPIRAAKKRSPGSYKWSDFYEKFNFVERWPEIVEKYGPTFDLVVSTEVYEHMLEKYQPGYLKGCFEVLRPGGVMILSTPVYDGKKMAKNHLAEQTVEHLRKDLEDAGFEIVHRYGTFANYHHIRRGLKARYGEEQGQFLIDMYEEIRGFMDDNLLACFLAPLLPDYSRNNAWVVQKPGGEALFLPDPDTYLPDPSMEDGNNTESDQYPLVEIDKRYADDPDAPRGGEIE